MTTLPSDVPIASILSTDEKSIPHSNTDDTVSKANPSNDIEQSNQKLVNSRPLEDNLRQLEINDIDNEQLRSVPSSSDSDRQPTLQNEQSVESQPSILSDQKDVSEPVLSKSSTSDGNTTVSYGVDWSDHAHPTSHCWFPLTSDDVATIQSCTYTACTNPKSIYESTLIRCASCALIIHSHHLDDLQATKADFLPHCRPSFVDDNDNSSKYDQHFWSDVSILPKPCLQCQRASVATTLFGSDDSPLSSLSALNIPGQLTSFMNSVPGNLIPKMWESSKGLVCLWCSAGYHRSCWEYLSAQEGKIQCDYGIFRNIIVRPQWLTRSNESSTGFRARLPSDLINKSTESNSSPFTPVIVFINKRSGGQVGEKLYRKLLGKLNPRQVFLLENNDTINNALNIYSSLPNTRICVFGGDGTVGWVLSRLADIYPSSNQPPVSIFPLGTGNDLSRVLGWGEEYDSKRLYNTLLKIPDAQTAVLDRWQVQLEEFDVPTLISTEPKPSENNFDIRKKFETLFKQPPTFVRETTRDAYQNNNKLPNTRFINYMSFGLDAAITLDFHHERTLNPAKFSSPLNNKLMYLNESCKYIEDFARADMWNLGSYIHLICDGSDLTDAIRDCHTLVILNIPGYASGTNPWGKSSSTSLLSCFEVSTDLFDRQDFGDRKIEVVGLTTKHMAAIHVGFRGIRIAQCNQLRVELCCPMTAQMDGEPFYLPKPVAVNISHAGQVLVLNNENK
ncbi:unnamed protein product [Adineta steineri]|uniref:Diacylglycerol kinase n=1 Tax=Adineta steineri TaxID=433720 RepID=A0A819JFA7_9BILA|nr:unnamed protein product [Adineta steineri]CAF3931996.1 unnamed protein product [Adineta steineri]